MSRDSDKARERTDVANEIIRIIASHGRHFLSMNSDRRAIEPSARVSRFEWVGGRLYYRDKYTDKLLYVHHDARFGILNRGFSDGGTLRAVVLHLRDFIRGKSVVNIRHFGPWPEWVCGGDLWGYGDEMDAVRSKIAELLESRARDLGAE